MLSVTNQSVLSTGQFVLLPATWNLRAGVLTRVKMQIHIFFQGLKHTKQKCSHPMLKLHQSVLTYVLLPILIEPLTWEDSLFGIQSHQMFGLLNTFESHSAQLGGSLAENNRTSLIS